MATEVRLPQWGMGMQEGTVTEWHKQEGDEVEQGEVIAEIEAAKSVEDLTAPASGVLARIVVEVGRLVPVHELLAVIAAPDEQLDEGSGQGAGPSGRQEADSFGRREAAPPGREEAGGVTDVAPEDAGAGAEPVAAGVVEPSGTGPQAGSEPAPGAVSDVGPEDAGATAEPAGAGVAARGDGAHVRNVVPLARKIAKERGIDLATVQGTGPGGRISAEDVRQAADAGAMPAGDRTSEPETDPTAARRAGGHVRNVVPRARKLAKEHGIDLRSVTGSGPGGRITVADVEHVVELSASSLAGAGTGAGAGEPVAAGAPAAGAPAAGTPAAQRRAAEEAAGEAVPMSGMRGTIARRMHASLQSMAQLTLVTTADVTDLVGYREQISGAPRPTYTDMVVRAVALALRQHPALNARVEEDRIVRLPGVHIGVATALDEGLVVPVVRDADRKSLAELAAETADLVARTRSGRASSEEISGSTFSVSSLGGQGIDAFTPIINPPEVAILGVGRIVDHPARYGTGMVWRKEMTLSLTIDHRVVDGAPGAAFLQTVTSLLGRPVALAG